MSYFGRQATSDLDLGTFTVDLTITTKQAIFTVPAGLRSLVLLVEARDPNGTIGVTSTVSFGFNAAADDVVAGHNPKDIDTTDVYGLIFPDNPATIGTAGQVFGVILANANSGTATTAELRVIGRELV